MSNIAEILALAKLCNNGGGGASSWNGLKDKPFYVEEPKPMFDGEIDCSKSPYHFNPPLDVIENKNYQVFIDGIECNTTTWWDDGEYGIHVADGTTPVMDVYRDSAYISTDFTGSHKITIVDPSKQIIHKLDGKYLPDPFWVEEKKTLVVEGLSDNNFYDVQITLEKGKEYTFVIDEVEYTGKCILDDIDLCIYLRNSLDTVAIVYEYGISMREHEDTFHKIELVEQVYRTHHDFLVKISRNEGTGESDYQLLAGNFESAKAKILKGLHATAFVCVTTFGEGYTETTNYVRDVSYYQQGNREKCSFDGLNVLSDNTIMTA